MFSIESPHRGDSDEYTQYTIFNMKKKNNLNYPKSAARDCFQGTLERVRNSRGKRANSVRAFEVLLLFVSSRVRRWYKHTGTFQNIGAVRYLI